MNDFFADHPLLGGMFDFDRDGSLDLGEAMYMGGMAGMLADEMDRSSGRRDKNSFLWDDDDDDRDDYGLNDGYDFDDGFDDFDDEDDYDDEDDEDDEDDYGADDDFGFYDDDE